MVKLLLAVTLLCVCACAQSVEGIVGNSVTGIPIAGIKIDIVQGTDVNSAATDPRGHFLFDNLKNGTWAIRIQVPDYAAHSEPVQVIKGTPVKLQLRLMPLPRVSGRVLDSEGVPAPKATLLLISAHGVWTGSADAAGKFEMHQLLPPGDYTLSAAAPSGLEPPEPEDGGPVLGWVRTFYPGTHIRESASTIHLEPGVQVLDVEIKLQAIPRMRSADCVSTRMARLRPTPRSR
jgi:hypothetical protein